jgi:hypothetical protein
MKGGGCGGEDGVSQVVSYIEENSPFYFEKFLVLRVLE